MKKYRKQTELWIFLSLAVLQLLTFYVLPKFAGPIGAMGMVFVMIVITFALSAVLGAVLKGKAKFFYPIAAAALFLPSVFLYYNESAWIHAVWYLVISLAGIIAGVCIGKL